MVTAVAFIIGGLALVVALVVGIRIAQSVFKRSKEQGVVVSDGIDSNELRIMAKILQEELEENAELAALQNLARVAQKALAKKSSV